MSSRRQIPTKLKGKELGRPRYRWEGNVIMNIREIGWEGVG
jgi:hypothetical protein